MRTYIRKTFVLFAAFSCFFFLSCNDVIFDEIRNEVKLDDAKVFGDIKSIIRYTLNGEECIFVADGKDILYRSVAGDTVGQKIDWKELPFSSTTVYDLAADAEYLYAFSLSWGEDEDGYNVPITRSVWCSADGSNWEMIFEEPYSDRTAAILFCTNTIKAENRHAYFRIGSETYELSGATKKEELKPFSVEKNSDYICSSKKVDGAASEEQNSFAPKNCTVLNGEVYFSSASAIASNETADTDATHIYYSSGDNVYYSSDGTAWERVDLNCDTIRCMATTNDYFYAGTTEGVVHTPWNPEKHGVPSNGNSDFSNNANSALSSYYEIQSILVVNPEEKERECTMFASLDFEGSTSSSSANMKNIGLWSYYPFRSEWNRE